MTADARLDTGIESSAAVLPGPPASWSYSSLKEIGACPRRYALSRADYPDLWSGRGYPRLPSLPAMFGNVVHDALETIVRAFIAGGCESPQSAEAVQVLRQLGGYTAVISAAAEARLSALAGNPRLGDDLRQRIERGLRGQVADARVLVQTYVSDSSLSSNGITSGARPASAGSPAGGRRGPLRRGAHAEVTLVASELRLMGRVDLLRVTESGAHITDYKTGAESPGHAEQLSLYALLWNLDQDANPAALPVTGLTAAYPGCDVAIPVPDEQALRDIEKRVTATIAEADEELAAAVPRAVPSPENCQNCHVRQLCDAYWPALAPDPSSLPDQAKFDCQGIVGTRNGQRSWWFHLDGPVRSTLLVQAPPSGPDLVPGRHVRILGLRIDAALDSTATAASMNSMTEVFQLTPVPGY
jgi:PD-(D/E)XK nuclease superfamily